MVSFDPSILVFAGSKGQATENNILRHKEFVVNIVDEGKELELALAGGARIMGLRMEDVAKLLGLAQQALLKWFCSEISDLIRVRRKRLNIP